MNATKLCKTCNKIGLYKNKYSSSNNISLINKSYSMIHFLQQCIKLNKIVFPLSGSTLCCQICNDHQNQVLSCLVYTFVYSILVSLFHRLTYLTIKPSDSCCCSQTLPRMPCRLSGVHQIGLKHCLLVRVQLVITSPQSFNLTISPNPPHFILLSLFPTLDFLPRGSLFLLSFTSLC